MLGACSTEKAGPVVLFDDAIDSTLGAWSWLQEGTDPSSSSYQDEVFQPDPSGGSYLHVQFHNLTDQWVTVILLRLEADGTISPSDDLGSVILLRVDGGAQASETVRSTAGAWSSPSFGTATQEGDRLCVWFQNTTGEAVTVYLRRIDQGPQTIVAQLSVPGHAQDAVVYHHRAADRGSYLLMVEATASGGLIAGTVALTQCGAAP